MQWQILLKNKMVKGKFHATSHCIIKIWRYVRKLGGNKSFRELDTRFCRVSWQPIRINLVAKLCFPNRFSKRSRGEDLQGVEHTNRRCFGYPKRILFNVTLWNASDFCSNIIINLFSCSIYYLKICEITAFNKRVQKNRCWYWFK